jgi:hypothetical protein
MTAFLKKGINKARDKFIYPEPTQTNTPNCAAYAGAGCLWAMALDHCGGLIPSASGGTAEAQFQYQIAKIVERLTKLIYSDDKSVADGLRKYIDETGCSGDLEVTEFTASGKEKRPNGQDQDAFDFAISELRRCQDVIPFIKWDKPKEKKGKARHAVTLTGIDPKKGEVIAANPWGEPRDSVHVPPDEAGRRTENGQSGGHNRYKYTKASDGTVSVDFEGFKAVIYHYVMVCPKRSAAKVDSTGGKTYVPKPKEVPSLRYRYSVQNTALPVVNGFAISLDGLSPADILRVSGPMDWSAQLWFDDREAEFGLRAPDVIRDPARGSIFRGIIWRTEGAGLKPRAKRAEFSFDVGQPRFLTPVLEQEILDLVSVLKGRHHKSIRRLLALVEKAQSWRDDSGDAILLNESALGTQALHLSALTPKPYCDAPALLARLLGKG